MASATKLGLTSALVLSVCLTTGSGFAKSGSKGKSGNSSVELEAELEPTIVSPATTAIEPDAEGEVKYKKQIQKGNPKNERFEATVKIPFPSTALGIIDLPSAQNADVQLLLSSVTTPTVAYAACALDFTEVDTEFEDGAQKAYAVYKVDVRRELRRGALRQREVHGVCDTNPATPGIENGTPAPTENDIATAVLVTTTPAPLTTGIVSGSFELH